MNPSKCILFLKIQNVYERNNSVFDHSPPSRLRMPGAVLLLPQYVFMAWYLLKFKDKLPLPFITRNYAALNRRLDLVFVVLKRQYLESALNQNKNERIQIAESFSAPCIEQNIAYIYIYIYIYICNGGAQSLSTTLKAHKNVITLLLCWAV
jgi:hypothetical protein